MMSEAKKTNGIKIPTKDGNFLCATQEWGCAIYSWYEDTEGNFLRLSDPKELLWAVLEWNTPTIPSNVDREKTGKPGVCWYTEEEEGASHHIPEGAKFMIIHQ